MLKQRYISDRAGPFSEVLPKPIDNPYWIAFNRPLAQQIDFPYAQTDELLAVFSGQATFANTQPIAQKYAGHQFGGWNPDLGDGRGLLLGEWADKKEQLWEFHLKGAGKTPYSRFGDGRAVLRSSIREYLGSEALNALGIPSTRALALIGSTEPVIRESVEQGAMLLRITQSHIRFGHFEWLASQQDVEGLKHLAQFAITHHFPKCQIETDPFAALFTKIVERTADLIGYWMAYGFVHGVMNTDNMNILGETFDYGPYAFIEQTRMNAVFNHTDQQGRYAYNQQPTIGLWNLQRLAQAFSFIVSPEQLKASLNRYSTICDSRYYQLLSNRLGGTDSQPIAPQLCHQWIQLLADNHLDFHWYFRQLSQLDLKDWHTLADDFVDREGFLDWCNAVKTCCHPDDQIRQQQMRQANPATVARTQYLQSVIESAQLGDFSPFETLAAALMSPFEERAEWAQWQTKPNFNNEPIILSCSS